MMFNIGSRRIINWNDKEWLWWSSGVTGKELRLFISGKDIIQSIFHLVLVSGAYDREYLPLIEVEGVSMLDC